MNQKQIIGAIKELKEIKPRQEWVSLVKFQIFDQADFAKQNVPVKTRKTWSISDFLPQFNYQTFHLLQKVKGQRQMAYAFATLVFMIVGMFGFAQYTMPGDLLFSVKKISEQTQSPFQIASNRSSDLVQILKENKTENIAPAVSEFKASIADAAKNLVQSLGQNDKKSLKELAAEVKKIQDNQKQAETLGIDISQTEEVKELDNALAELVKEQIDDLEKATLTEGQQKALTQAKDLYSQQKYYDALEEILLISN